MRLREVSGAWGRGRWIVLGIAVLAILLVSCTSPRGGQMENAGPSPSDDPAMDGSSPSVSGSPVATPSPTPLPSRPRNPSQAPLDGTYNVKFTLAKSNVSGARQHEVARWVMDPNCRRGPCTTRLESLRGNYVVRAVFVKRRYRWTRKLPAGYTCGQGNESVDIPSISSLSLQPTAMRIIDEVWVVTRFTGVEESRGLKGGGCFPIAEERSIFKGVRIA
jgi:hypothetical protein